jgi:UDP-glucose 4-epimerase
MTRIAITGGAGFVGSNLALRLHEKGYDVVIVDDFSTGSAENLEFLSKKIEPVSILDKEKLFSTLTGTEFIYHLAARGSVPRSLSDPIGTFQNNVIGTLNILEYVRSSRIPFVFSSSSSVYGPVHNGPKNEEMSTYPVSPYAASKISAEKLIYSYEKSFGIDATVYRFFNIYGRFQNPESVYAAVIPKWIWSALENKTLELFGPADISRDFTPVKSVVEVLILGMERKIYGQGPINLAFGESISLGQVLSLLKNHFPRLQYSQLEERAGDVPKSQSDTSKFRKYFPDVKSMEFATGLQDTILWLRKRHESRLEPVLKRVSP